MSSMEFVHLRCDRPGCQVTARMALDAPGPEMFKKFEGPRVDSTTDVRGVAAAEGWTTFTWYGGLLGASTADYCPKHAGSGLIGIRGLAGGGPTRIEEPLLVVTDHAAVAS